MPPEAACVPTFSGTLEEINAYQQGFHASVQSAEYFGNNKNKVEKIHRAKNEN